MPIKKILVANRSEIAIRVFRAANELNIKTVACYAEEDKLALHRFKADEAYLIGKGKGPVEAYLQIDEYIRVARAAGADAIHPGYGLLSESPEFAEACEDAGIIFIGPKPQTMRDLGNKVAARNMAIAAGVPVVPATEALPDDMEEVKRLAAAIGYPLMLKASWGGGGRGMRRIMDEKSLVAEVSEGKREAKAAFGKDEMYLEKLIERARHVEVQLIGDQHGNVIHLFERDCSLQRRHQKLVEESPSPNLPDAVRKEMCAAAVRLAKEAKYYNAGTCEFLVDQQNNFYFIEVNARVQVEHPVTELVTGVDVIREQIRVAAGEKLSYAQKDVVQRGCAIEVRINAEDPARDFRPSAGVVKTWRPPGGPGVRLDSHVCAGYRVPSNYDSMVAKLLVHQPTRAEAFAVMRRALREFIVEGIHTTIPILRTIFDTPAFIEGKVDTTYIERELMPNWPG